MFGCNNQVFFVHMFYWYVFIIQWFCHFHTVSWTPLTSYRPFLAPLDQKLNWEFLSRVTPLSVVVCDAGFVVVVNFSQFLLDQNQYFNFNPNWFIASMCEGDFICSTWRVSALLKGGWYWIGKNTLTTCKNHLPQNH